MVDGHGYSIRTVFEKIYQKKKKREGPFPNRAAVSKSANMENVSF